MHKCIYIIHVTEVHLQNEHVDVYTCMYIVWLVQLEVHVYMYTHAGIVRTNVACVVIMSKWKMEHVYQHVD